MQTTSEQSRSRSKTLVHLFLIHGVGLPAADVFGTSAERLLNTLDASNLVLERIDWHSVVPVPELSEYGLINIKQLTALFRGFIGSAARHRAILSQQLIEWCLLLAPILALMSRYFAVGNIMLFLLLPIFAFHVCSVTYSDGFLSAIRSVVVAVIRPLAFLISIVATPWGLLLLTALVGIIMSHVLFWSKEIPLIRGTAGDWIPDLGFDIANPNAQLLLAYLAGITCWVMFLLLGRTLIWPLKVFADILCLFGDQEYSDKLLNHLSARIGAKPFSRDDHIIIAAHSLGSTIAVTWLLLKSESVLPRDIRLTLITMGSPNARWIARFFRASFLPSEAIACELLARYPRFQWANIYRPMDVIGGKMFVELMDRAKDFSTKQYCRGHLGYWDDLIVAKLIYDFSITEIQAAPTSDKTSRPSTTMLGWKESNASIEFQRKATFTRFAESVVIGLLAAITFYNGVSLRFTTPAENRRLLANKGVEAQGWVYRYESFVVADKQVPSVFLVPHHFLVVEPPGSRKPIAFRGEIEDRFNLAKLFSRGTEVKAELQTDGIRMIGTKEAVRVKYLEESPGVLDIPELPLVGGAFFEKLGAYVLCFFVFIVAAGVTYYGVKVYSGC